MTLFTLLRPPAVWLVLVEVVLVAVLAAVTWHVWQQRVVQSGAALISQVPAPAPPAQPAGPSALVPSVLAPPSPQIGPTPGISTDPDFLARELGELNRVESTFEDLEWRVTKAVVDGVQRYLEGVVLPSVERTERGVR